MSNPSIESQLQKLTDDIATLGKSLASIARDRVTDYQQDAGRYVGRQVDRAYDRSRDAFKDLRSELVSVEDVIIGRIRANPLAAIGIIGGVALLLGLLGRSPSQK